MNVSTAVDLERVAERYFAAWEVRDLDAIVARKDTFVDSTQLQEQTK
jgi:hypothetical protein